MKAHADQPKASDFNTASRPETRDNLQTLPLAEVEKQLASSPDGLTQAEAQKRLTQYGPNEIAEKKTNEILKFLSYFWGPIPWMIEAAVILSAAARHWPDFGIILLLLLANAMVGFWEEHQAGNAIAALKATLAIKARVKRDGRWVNPAARELVPGDVIRLRLGDIVPADARLLDGDEISVDQSALTGESLPATRKSGDAVFSGSIVRRGEIDALVYATGGKTYFGKTAELVETAVTVSHFQKAVLKIGNYLIILALILVAVIIGLGVYRGEPILTVLQFALVLTVAAIPVAMPTVLSVTMAVGARLLAKKQAIVSKLVAIEELAGVDVLCADKTGTLTQNKLTLGDPFCLDADHRRRAHPCRRLGFASREQRHDRSRGPRRPEGQAGAEALSGHAFSAIRSRAQADRGHGQGRGWKDIQGDQGRAAGHPGAVGECGRGEVRRGQGCRRLCRARLSCAGRRARRRRRRMAASRRPAAVRSASGRRQIHRRDGGRDGREDQDGDRRRSGDRPRDGQDVGNGGEHPRREHARRRQERGNRRRQPRPSRMRTASLRCSPNTNSISSTCCRSTATSSA